MHFSIEYLGMCTGLFLDLTEAFLRTGRHWKLPPPRVPPGKRSHPPGILFIKENEWNIDHTELEGVCRELCFVKDSWP